MWAQACPDVRLRVCYPRETPVIDAHHHYWRVERGDYGWMQGNDAVAAIARDFLPPQLDDALAACDVTQTVLVQAAPTVEESDFLLEIADNTPHVAKVVGWIDFEDKASRAQLDRLSAHPAFAGVRPMIQDISDPEWMHGDGQRWAFKALIERDLAFDALGKPVHLDAFDRLFQRYPELRVVIDHGMKPAIGAREFDQWAVGMARIASTTNVCCKVSGLLTEAADGDGLEVLQPYVDHLIEVFGADRLMWGSDWPVLNLASDYVAWCQMARALVPEAAHEAVFHTTAARFYRIGS